MMINYRNQNLYNNYNNNSYSKIYQKNLEYYRNDSNNNIYFKNNIKNNNVNSLKNNSKFIKKIDNNSNKNFIEKNGFKFININNNVYNYYIFNQIINPYTNNNFNNKNIINSQNPNQISYLLNNNNNEQNIFNNNNFTLNKNINNNKIEEDENQNFPIFKLKLKISPKIILQFTIGRNDNVCQTFEMFCTSYKIPFEFYKPILTFIFVSINKFYLLYNWEINNENKKLLNEIYKKYVEKNNEKIFV